jgi:hypothetical protein
MNVFRSLDDELDGNGKAGSHWWIIPFMVTVCFLWGVLGFLSGGTDRKTAVAPSVPALQSQPEKEPPKLVVPAVERAGLWPPNDPDFKNCFRNGNGIRLAWQSTERAKPIYLIVRQRQGDGEWETWVEKTPVNGMAFTLTLRSAQARNSEFQWVLLQSQSNIPPESNYFCTRG